ncbi:MAG: DUF5693 family protein, partial [Syntrophomonas sp.]
MKLNFKWMLWILLGLTLILSGSGIYLRVSNENQNKTVVTVADYREFWKTAHAANMDLDETLARLKKAGVNTIALKEITLGDMAYNGDLYISHYGEFSVFPSSDYPSAQAAARQAIGDTYVSPDKLVIQCS